MKRLLLSVCRTGLGVLVVGIGFGVSLEAGNIAAEGTAILGVNDAIDEDAGTARVNAGAAGNINDGNPNSRVDNWFAGNEDIYSFVGVVWRSTRFDEIQTLNLTLATFTDGGWFGASGIGPGAGGALDFAFDLAEPSVQVTEDGGVTWSTVRHTSDYLLVMDGHTIGGGGNPNPTSATSVFTLDSPATEIDGIRIIGQNGGAAGGDGNGFLGVFELEVEAEPAADTDGDGLPDAWELSNGTDAGSDDAGEDLDGDGLANLEEFELGTGANEADTDGDGLNDGDEVAIHSTDAALADTDGDGLSDGDEIDMHGSHPVVADTDGDGLGDGDEILVHLTNALVRDTDADSFSDGLEVLQGTDPTNPASYPDNASLVGTGILGVNDAIDSDEGTPRFHAGAGAGINDGDLTTRVDNWFPEEDQIHSFVGILWPTPLTTHVKSLTLTLATFADGGWFGVSGTGPGTGGALEAALDLTEPTVQVSQDGGLNWETVGHSSDYTVALDGHGIGGDGNPNPTSVTAVFTLTEPVTGITGIRIIGENGGNAGPDANGFIGVFELEVTAGLADDADNDGLDDSWETSHGLTVGRDDSGEDPDDDGLSNIQEFAANTNPQKADTDGDGLKDGAEVSVHGTSPVLADTDDDGLEDGEEADGAGTDPLVADTDGDGLSDGEEVNGHGTDPTKIDTDGDGFEDAMEVAEGSDPVLASSVPGNIGLTGTAVIGTKESLESGSETALANAGVSGNINDGDITTRVDTFNGGSQSTVSYVGIIWEEPLTRAVTSLQLSLAIFFDGGWFGVNGAGPGSGSSLSAGLDLVEPIIQVSTDGGVTWATAPHFSNYLEALDGHPLPAVDFGPPTTATAVFELAEPAVGIDGIRIIGSEGGTASNGFLGVFELQVGADSSGDVQAVTLLNPGISGGQFQFEFDSQPGVMHRVEFKGSMDETEWQLAEEMVGDGNRETFKDDLEGGLRIYRVTSE